MAVLGIHHATLIVEDHDKAAWFYGEVLGLTGQRRPAFDFPGLFYNCGPDHEIHLIVASRSLGREGLFIRKGDGSEISLAHIHRHVALLVTDLPAIEERLRQNGIEILFTEERASPDDELTQNMMACWRKVYGGRTPIFFRDPSDNLIELIPRTES